MFHLKNILAPTDFSQFGGASIQYACDIARESGARLHLLHVTSEEEMELERMNQLKRIGEAIDSMLNKTTNKKVVVGNPANSIVEYARDQQIDLIVMGTHGRTGLAHLAIGSVTERVLKTAPCPVTVLGPRDGENATLSHALALIEAMIGEGWQMDQIMGRSLMAKNLVDSLRVPFTTAILMVEELETRQWLDWKKGCWNVVQGCDLVDDVVPAFVDPKAQPD